MKKNTFIVLFAILTLMTGCSKQSQNNQQSAVKVETQSKESGNTIKTRYKVPEGWRRVTPEEGSFAEYLQNLPLKPEGYVTHLYNGEEKPNKVSTAVVDMDIDPVDLQQCADAIIRLRAEYLYKTKQYDKIHFNFTNGFNCQYKKWAEGYRVKIAGNHAKWEKTDSVDYTYPTFRQYLLTVFKYAGTASLDKELEPIKGDGHSSDFGIGTIIINPGYPGHAVIVVDMIENIEEPWKKAVLLAQSYMPAQEIEILRGNGDEVGYFSIMHSPVNSESKEYWTTGHIGEKPIYAQGGLLCTVEYIFHNKKLKKFKPF